MTVQEQYEKLTEWRDMLEKVADGIEDAGLDDSLTGDAYKAICAAKSELARSRMVMRRLMIDMAQEAQ